MIRRGPRRGPRSRSTPRRSRACCRCRYPRSAPRCRSSRTPPMPAGHLPHRRAVPVRARQRATAGGVGRSVRAMGHPRARQAALRGGQRQLLPALAGEGRHRQLGAGSTATDHGRPGSHRARGHHQVHLKQYRGSAAVTDLAEFPRPGTQPHHRQRLARGGQRLPVLAGQAGIVTTMPETKMALRAHARGGAEELV